MNLWLDRLAVHVSQRRGYPEEQRSRRWLIRQAGKVLAAFSGSAAVGSIRAQEVAAGYSTYVIQNNTPCRTAPQPFASIVRRFNCGAYIFVNEVDGLYVCSCNECTGRWAQVKISPTGSVCYIHRGNLNPYNGGACECP